MLIRQAPREITVTPLYPNKVDATAFADKKYNACCCYQQMIKNREKLSEHYVSLTGMVNITPTALGGYIISMSSIESRIRMVNP